MTLDWIDWLNAHHGLSFYAALAVVVALENLPVIGTLILVQPLLAFLGYSAHQSQLSFLGVWLGAATGSVLADQIGFWLGHRLGKPLLDRLQKRFHLDDARLMSLQGRMHRYLLPALLVAKFNPISRTAAPPLAGMSGIPWATFALRSLIAALLWAGLWVGGGYILTHGWLSWLQ